MIYFTSDTHFNHKNIAGPSVSNWNSGYRDFASIEEMNECIIDNINSVVKEHDVLYHLGDFAFGNKNEIPNLRSAIKCREIHLIYGNHDHALRKYHRSCFTSTQSTIDELFINKHHFHLNHYPIYSWNGIGRGCIHLHGHIHRRNNDTHFYGKRFDVGVDANNYTPVSVDYILDWAEKVPVKVPEGDHHNEHTPIR